MSSRVAAVMLVAVAPACAWDAGEHFGTLDATVEARLDVPAGRDLGGGWQKLASDYEVRFTAFEVSAAALGLVDTGDTALSFDPANPPPGYTLCHNGHCHATDGRLVPYEDIAAELAGGPGPTEIVSLPVGVLDVLGGAAIAPACDAVCGLPRATVGQVRLHVDAVHLAGLVRDGRTPARLDGELPFAFDAVTVLPLLGRVDLPIDRASPPDIELAVELAPSSAVLDEVAWDEVSELEALGDDPVARDDVLVGLAETALTLEVER